MRQDKKSVSKKTLEQAEEKLKENFEKVEQSEKEIINSTDDAFLGVAYISFKYMWEADLVYKERKSGKTGYFGIFCTSKDYFVDKKTKKSRFCLTI